MSPARSGPPFREIWKTWHIYGVRNPRTYGMGNGEGEYRLLDGIEDLIRHSMRLRAMSQRALREEQLREGWTNTELVEHLRGDHDDEHQFDDGSVYGQLKYLVAEDEASKFIPEQVLRELRAEHGDAPAFEKRYFANRDDENPLETTVLAQQGRWFTLRRNEGDGVSFEAKGVLEAIRLHPDLLAVAPEGKTVIDAALGDEVVGSELRLAAPVPDAVDNLEDGYSFFLEDRFSLRDVLCQVNGTDWWLYEPDNGDPFFVPIDFEDRVEICARLYCESNDPESIPMSDDGGQWYSEELQRVGNVYWYEDSRWGGDPSPHHRQLYRTQKSPREEALSFFQTSDHLATYGVPNDYLELESEDLLDSDFIELLKEPEHGVPGTAYGPVLHPESVVVVNGVTWVRGTTGARLPPRLS